MTGVNALRRALKRVEADVAEAAERALLEAGRELRDDIAESMRAPKTGTTYPDPETGGAHTASAPGEAPAVATGGLLDAVRVRPAQDGPGITVGVHDGPEAEQAARLEFGTRVMAARPWLVPALERNRARIGKRVEAALTQALERIGRKR